MKASKDDLEVVDKAQPYIRSIAALALYLRFGSSRGVEDCYTTADKFIAQLKQDMQ